MDEDYRVTWDAERKVHIDEDGHPIEQRLPGGDPDVLWSR